MRSRVAGSAACLAGTPSRGTGSGRRGASGVWPGDYPSRGNFSADRMAVTLRPAGPRSPPPALPTPRRTILPVPQCPLSTLGKRRLAPRPHPWRTAPHDPHRVAPPRFWRSPSERAALCRQRAGATWAKGAGKTSPPHLHPIAPGTDPDSVLLESLDQAVATVGCRAPCALQWSIPWKPRGRYALPSRATRTTGSPRPAGKQRGRTRWTGWRRATPRPVSWASGSAKRTNGDAKRHGERPLRSGTGSCSTDARRSRRQ
jgi:hypothetical protein